MGLRIDFFKGYARLTSQSRRFKNKK